jgi:hypothetical protein
MLLLAVLLGSLHVLHLRAAVPLSKVDELVHLDYLIRAAEPRAVLDETDSLAPETMREAACRRSYAQRFPPCGRPHYDPASFTWEGYNPSASHPPLYYLATGLTARALRVPFGGVTYATWGRLLGLAWVLAGCYLALRVGETFEVPRRVLVAVIVMVAAAPAQLAASTMVNPDASALFAGALVVFAAVQVDREAWRWWAMPLCSFIALALDPTNAVAVIAALGYLALRMVADAGPGRRPRLWAAASGAGGAIVSVLAWQVLFRVASTARDMTGSPGAAVYAVESLPARLVVGADALFSMFMPLTTGFEAPVMKTEAVALLTRAVALVLVGGLVGTVLRARLRERSAAMAMATIGAMVVAGPLFILRNFYLAGGYFPIPQRYGLSALPALAVIVGIAAATSVGRAVVYIAAFGLYLASLIALMT